MAVEEGMSSTGVEFRGTVRAFTGEEWDLLIEDDAGAVHYVTEALEPFEGRHVKVTVVVEELE